MSVSAIQFEIRWNVCGGLNWGAMCPAPCTVAKVKSPSYFSRYPATWPSTKYARHCSSVSHYSELIHLSEPMVGTAPSVSPEKNNFLYL